MFPDQLDSFINSPSSSCIRHITSSLAHTQPQPLIQHPSPSFWPNIPRKVNDPNQTRAMYGSPSHYGSYSAMATPMDIAPKYMSSRAADASCAFPSWPRRSSLSASDSEAECRPSGYLSDADLLFDDAFEDSSDARSECSSSVSRSQSPNVHLAMMMRSSSESSPLAEVADIEALERDQRAAYQREVVRFIFNEKERRRQQALRRAAACAAPPRRQRHDSSGSAASGTLAGPARMATKPTKLSAITEAE